MEHKVATQIFLSHHRILSKFLTRALEEDFSLKEKISTVGDTKSFRCIVVGDKDTDILLLQLIHNALNIFHRDRVDTGKRLVEHNESRIDGEAARNFATAAFTTRKTVTQVFSHLLQVELVEQLFKFVALVFGRGVGHFEHESQIVFHRERPKHRRLLRQIADAEFGALIHG